MTDEERQDDAPLDDSEPTAAPDEVPADAGDDAGGTPDVTESSADDAPDAVGGARPEDVAGDEASAPAEDGIGGARSEDVAGDEASAPADQVPSVEDLPAPDSAADAETGDPAAETEAAAETPAPAEDAPAEDAPAEDAPAEPPAGDAPAAADAPAAEAAPERAPRRDAKAGSDEPEVIPGAHLEPDLVLDQPAGEADEYAQYADPSAEGDEGAEAGDGDDAESAPTVRSPLDLAADARYQATGKRKSAIARVVVKPGSGTYTVNGRSLEEFFPRIRLQKAARQPLEATGNHQRMDVVARIHGGGVAAQAGALRHGIARALVEASPELRTELKRRGYLTRDPREKERKKAGLKKARKRPQFSKR